jgi:pyruvate dehydrogenase E2 component (dihydrolipoamide acetyltransferase)
MTTDADLVMPKLGLTMTEGKVARWAIGPGQAFAAGNVLVVVETDKIAFDVEAPGSGSLAEIVVPEGETVAVGMPIARWVPSDPAASVTVKSPTEPMPEAKAQANPAGADDRPIASAASDRGRVIATPYARRLARQGHIDLAMLIPANGRRITAADVAKALAGRDERASEATLPSGTPQAGASSAANFSFYGLAVCVDRLQAVMGDIDAALPELRPLLRHFVALAASRALGPGRGHIAFERDGAERRCLSFDATRSLSAIVAGDRAERPSTDGRIVLSITEAQGVSLIGRAPVGSAGVLGVGAPTRSFRPDGEGHPVLRTEVSLLLTVGDAEALPDAAGLLTSIGRLLESPLVLLAS